MRWKLGICVVGVLSVWNGYAGAANQVVVESKTVLAGATGVVIGVQMTNDTPLAGIVIPLKVRAVTQGSFITHLALSWGGRLDSSLTDFKVNNQYTNENYSCSGGGLGFADTVTSVANLSKAVAASPAGLMFVRLGSEPPFLPVGTDTAPSMKLVVDVTGTPGTFEVDTSCTLRGNHLAFVGDSPPEELPTSLLPSFTKGIITIAACNCDHHGDLTGNGVIDILDVLALQNYIYNGTPVPVKDPLCPHVDRGDVNCSGYDDTVDLVYLIDYVFNGGDAPCNPCACTPYPTNCP